MKNWKEDVPLPKGLLPSWKLEQENIWYSPKKLAQVYKEDVEHNPSFPVGTCFNNDPPPPTITCDG